MSKKSEISDLVANSMAQLLDDENFTKIFRPKAKSVSTELNLEDKTAVSDYNSFESFVSLAKKKKDKKDKDKDKGDEKDKDAEDNKKNKTKKSKAASKCDCNADCSCKDGKKCDCDCCVDCAACGDRMYVSALKYMIESLTRTSEVLDNMGLEKSAISTMVALNHIIEEVAQSKYATLDENDARGMDLLLGLEDSEALADFEDEELDDPASSAALEEILKSSPGLAADLSENLKNKFEVEDQLKNRVKARLENITEEVPPSGDDSDIEELAAKKLPNIDIPNDVPPVSSEMKAIQDEQLGGTPTMPVPADEWIGDNVDLNFPPNYSANFATEDPEVVRSFQELNEWVKEAELSEGDNELNVEEFDSMLEQFAQG